jgi:hypothetical protein
MRGSRKRSVVGQFDDLIALARELRIDERPITRA